MMLSDSDSNDGSKIQTILRCNLCPFYIPDNPETLRQHKKKTHGADTTSDCAGPSGSAKSDKSPSSSSSSPNSSSTSSSSASSSSSFASQEPATEENRPTPRQDPISEKSKCPEWKKNSPVPPLFDGT